MMIIMMVIIEIIMVMKIKFLGGMMGIKKERPRKQRLRKSSYLLLDIHQDIGIGVCQKMKNKTNKTKKKQKNYDHKHETFLYLMTGYKKLFLDQLDLKNMSLQWSVICQMKLKQSLMLTEIFGLNGPTLETS